MENVASPVPSASAATERRPVRRIKFDRWLFDNDIDNVGAGKLLNCHPLTIGRYRKPFDDLDRRKPGADFIRAVEVLTDGEVTFEDWFRPCGVIYVPADAPPITEAAE